MIDIKKKIQAARDYASKSYRVIRKVSKNGFMVQRDKNADKHFLDGIDWAEKEIFKDLIHNANEVPQIGRGRILAYSRDCGYRNLYNLYDMMYKTDCGTYQEMWELEVKAYRLNGWMSVIDAEKCLVAQILALHYSATKKSILVTTQTGK